MAKAFDPTPGVSGNFKRAAVQAGIWTIVRAMWTNVAAFLVFSFLVNRLSLADVGIFALASSYVEVIKVIAGAGIGESVQREAQLDDLDVSTAFWGGAVLSVAFSIILCALAPLLSTFMAEPRLVGLIYALSALMVISSLSRIHWALTLREFGHRLATIQTIVATLIGGGGAVIAVLMGAGVWALLVQSIASELVGFVLVWRYQKWRPQWRFDLSRLVKLLRFGGGMVITHLLWTLLSRVPDFFIGRTLGVQAVGVYRIGWRLVDLIGQVLMGPLGDITFLSLARLQHDQQKFENAYVRVLGLGAVIMFPIMTGFGVLSPEIIPMLFGKQTAASVPVAQILAFSAVPFVLNYFISASLSAKGRSFVMSQIAVVQLVTTIAASLVGVKYGIAAVALAYVIRSYVTLPYQQIMLKKYTGIGLIRAIGTICPPLFCSIVMAVAVYALQYFIKTYVNNVIILVMLLTFFGFILYIALLIIFDKQKLMSNIYFIKEVSSNKL